MPPSPTRPRSPWRSILRGQEMGLRDIAARLVITRAVLSRAVTHRDTAAMPGLVHAEQDVGSDHPGPAGAPAWLGSGGHAARVGRVTAADHLTVLEAAIAALPPGFRRRLMVTVDGAGASHELITRLDKLATRPGHQLTYSVGWELGKRERAAIAQVPGQAWQIAIDARGEIRERRAHDACDDDTCGHRACWIEEAHVTELTGLLRKGPGRDRLAAWPASMRVFARRERPHPGAQLTLFEIENGYRYTLWVTNLPEVTRGWRGNQAYIDAAHRVHARVEDGIRTGKDTGIGRFPSEAMAMNKAWLAAALIAATLLAWLRLLALDGKLARAGPKTLRYKVLHAAGWLTRGARRRQLRIQASWPWAGDITRAWGRICALSNGP